MPVAGRDRVDGFGKGCIGAWETIPAAPAEEIVRQSPAIQWMVLRILALFIVVV